MKCILTARWLSGYPCLSEHQITAAFQCSPPQVDCLLMYTESLSTPFQQCIRRVLHVPPTLWYGLNFLALGAPLQSSLSHEMQCNHVNHHAVRPW
jgi:hypothetical protein